LHWSFRIERPNDHPLRTNLDGRTDRTAFRCAGLHVDNACHRIGWRGFARGQIRAPLLRRSIRARCRTADDSGIAGQAREPVISFSQNNLFALGIAALDARRLRHLHGARRNRTRDLSLSGFTCGTDTFVNIHVAAIGSVRHLRVDCALNEKQRVENGERQAVAADVFHKETIAKRSRESELREPFVRTN